jgi:hypothetical protein
LPFGSTGALLTAYAIRAWPVGGGAISHSACCIARLIEMRTTRPRIRLRWLWQWLTHASGSALAFSAELGVN